MVSPGGERREGLFLLTRAAEIHLVLELECIIPCTISFLGMIDAASV